ncbi:alpha-galactosidase [Corynebacterium durum]|uniref:alpha-galactosidase n=1 Tax=Corynebacterium durum TaxID=61592 RepID=UPI0028EF813E|nr:alpha-galactosidase [Corynebacterium durum]
MTIHVTDTLFHLRNDSLSYIMQILPNGYLGQLYVGTAVPLDVDYSYLLEFATRPTSACPFYDNPVFSLEHVKQEYGQYGGSDYRQPAVVMSQPDGSTVTTFQYESHRIEAGKPRLDGLPATYVEDDSEAETLIIVLVDPLTTVRIELSYTLFSSRPVLTRTARFINDGHAEVFLDQAMSACLDLPDAEYEWWQFSGAWGRERHLKTRTLEQGITSIGSIRGNSSAQQNPFVILASPGTDDLQGEAIGCAFVYSGNFLIQAEVDTFDTTRLLVGIHPQGFRWKLRPGSSFQTPEVVFAYTTEGLNDLSATLHSLFRERLMRGQWRDRSRPIVTNNWEATYFDFTEDTLIDIARTAQGVGAELFVLDDGWFGARRGERAGLGDWTPNTDLLPDGVAGLSKKVTDLGIDFGLWVEPEMVNEDSDLFRTHPDWVIQTPNRRRSVGRFQLVLDYSRAEVVDHVFTQLSDVFSTAKISYVKWDMNRSLTEVFSSALPTDQQGEVAHRHMLGVYALLERLTTAFPHILFESCASGGARFDAGMLFYAPQAWASDDSDAVERLKIQWGSSFAYPIISHGAHVSITPNHQVNRVTPLHTRANVAFFGAFGYELDLNKLSDEEIAEVKAQVTFMKEHRELIQFGTFYRLRSPFDSNVTCWMVVNKQKTKAIVGWYRVLNTVNAPFDRVRLVGLDTTKRYRITGNELVDGRDVVRSGSELHNIGLITSDRNSGDVPQNMTPNRDFDSRLFVLTAE